MATIKSTVTTENRINANVSPPTKIVPKNVLIQDVTKQHVGLGNVDNTSDINKPVSAATQTALDLKANQSTTYTKTEVDAEVTAAETAASSALTAHADLTNNPHSVTKTQVGLSNVEDKSAATIIGEIVDSDIPSTITRDSELSAHTSLTNNPHSVTKTQVGLSNVDNESKAVMFTDPTFTGNPQSNAAPTSNDHLTNKTYVDAQVAGVVDSAPAALDTLNELAAALGDDQNFATTTATSIGEKLAKASNLSDLNDDATARTNLGLGNVEDKSAATIISEIVDSDIPSTIARDSELTAHTSLTNNPHSVTKTQVGLGNVTNESKSTMFAGAVFTGDLTSDTDTLFVDSTNHRVGIGTTSPDTTLDMDGHFRLLVSPENRVDGQASALIKGTGGRAANLRVVGPVTVTHDLFKNSGDTGGFADNSNHFHTVQKINRITQQSGSGTPNERVQEQYYAIENNNLKNNKAAFWNWHRVSKEVSSTSVSLTNLVGWDVSGIQDSSNRTATSQVLFPTGGAEATTFTFDTAGNNPFALNDVLRITVNIDFEGAIVAATNFAKVTAVSGTTATVVLYGGNYKTTDEVADGNSQTAVTAGFSIKKIDTAQYMPLASGTGIDVLSDSTRTTTTDTFKITFASAHGLELNDTVSIITDNTGGFQAAEVAFVKSVGSTTEATFVYGRVFEPASRLALSDIGSGSVVGILKGTLDGLHRFTAGDQLMHFNADNEGRYKSYQIGPGSEVGADCIAIGKNVYNKDASTIKIGYDNAMLDVRSDGIIVEGTATADTPTASTHLTTKAYVDAQITGAGTSASSGLSAHTSLTNNPHSVTKAQVGLGSVEDKSSATIRSEIVDSDIPNTITRDSELTAHTSLTNNPHSVTKAQVGLTNVEDKSAATIIGEIVDSDIPSTIARDSELTAHTSLTNNPHSVTAAQVGLGNVEDKSAATIIGEIVDSDIPSTITRDSELSAHTSLTNNPHSVTATQVGLGSVEDKSSATIRSEIVDGDIPSTITRDSELSAHTSLTDNPHSVTRAQLNIDTTDTVTFGGVNVSTAPTSGNHLTNKTYVDAQVAGVVDSAPAALDTLNELAAALGDDASFATTTATSIGEKLAKASNLLDLNNVATARTNLGLGTAATTASSDYAPAAGSSSITTVGTIGTGTWQGTAIADAYISSASTWNGKQDALTFGTASGNALKSEEALAENDILLAGASNVKGRTYSELKTDLGLGNVTDESKSTMFTNPAFTGTISSSGLLDFGHRTSNATIIRAESDAHDITLIRAASNSDAVGVSLKYIGSGNGDENIFEIVTDGGGSLKIDNSGDVGINTAPVDGIDLAVGTFTSSGNVGIGTNTTSEALDVVGNITASGSVTGATLAGTLSTAAQPNITSVGTLTGLTVSGAVTIDSQTLTVDSTNDRVGVGTNAPGAPLHIRKSVSGGNLVRQLRLTNDTNAQGTGSGIAFNNADNSGEGHGDFINAAIDSVDTESGLRSGNLIFSTRPNNTGGDAAVIERMRINATGEVGIGKTATAGVELDVSGDIAASGSVSTNTVSAPSNSNLSLNGGGNNVNITSNNVIISGSSVSANADNLSLTESLFSISAASGNCFNVSDGSNGVDFLSGNITTGVFSITGNLVTTSNVGIGVAAPTARLHVKNTSSGNVLRQLRLHNDSTTAGTGTGIAFTNSSSETFVNASIDSVRDTSTANGNLVFSTRADAAANDDNAVVERMRINPTGEVGIGKTATTGVELDVSGDIAASGNLSIDTNILKVDTTLNKVGIKHTPVAASADLHVNGSMIVASGVEKGLSIIPGAYQYSIGDIDGGENGTYLEIDSTNVFARLHGGGLAIGKALTTGKTLDVNGDALMNSLTVDGTLSVPGELNTSTDIECTGGAGINATGTIEAKGYSLKSTSFTVVSTTSTLAASTNGLTVILQNTGPITITLPTLAAGHVTTFISETIHGVTFVGATGITVNSFQGANTTAGQFAQCQVIYKTTTAAFLGGNLT